MLILSLLFFKYFDSLLLLMLSLLLLYCCYCCWLLMVLLLLLMLLLLLLLVAFVVVVVAVAVVIDVVVGCCCCRQDNGSFHAKWAKICDTSTFTLSDFNEIFTSWRYQWNLKILKISAHNSKPFQKYGPLKFCPFLLCPIYANKSHF